MAYFAYQQYFVGKNDKDSFCPLTSAFDYWLKMTSSPIRYGLSYDYSYAYKGSELVYNPGYHGGYKAKQDFMFDHVYFEIMIKRVCYILFCIFIFFSILNIVVCRKIYGKLKGVLIYHITESILDVIGPAFTLLVERSGEGPKGPSRLPLRFW